MDTDELVISRADLFDRLLPVVQDRYRALVAAGAGLRWGECAGLRWGAVDLAASVLRVVRVAEEVSGHVTLKPYPKSRAGRRTVPLPPFVVQALTDHRQSFETGTDGLIFVARTGEPLKRGTFGLGSGSPPCDAPACHSGSGSMTCGTPTRRGSSPTGYRSTT
ncbi:tyrosine-type recombinase/integrase [Micromonospora chalcea]|uniref:tyrosine-type recombinase/integrase n=1 Tax=Micromonospora chalcea TaxID=1874 RepID=UPI003791DD14